MSRPATRSDAEYIIFYSAVGATDGRSHELTHRGQNLGGRERRAVAKLGEQQPGGEQEGGKGCMRKGGSHEQVANAER